MANELQDRGTQDTMNKIAVMGLGWWGSRMARNFASHAVLGPQNTLGVDPMEQRRTEMTKSLGIETLAQPEEAFARPDITGVVIATPVPTHFALASAAFAAGKHVLVTKPPTPTLHELEILVAQAASAGLVFMLDSTFVYSEAVRAARVALAGGAVPDVGFVQSLRWGSDLRLQPLSRIKATKLALGVDVLQDLVFHDLAILRFLFPDVAMKVGAVHRSNSLARYTPPEFAATMCDTASVWLESDRFPVHINLSWVLPERRRELVVAGPEVQLVYDDMKTEGKLTLFRTEDKQESAVPHGNREPLSLVADHFLECIASRCAPLTDGHYMLDLMALYEAVQRFPRNTRSV